MKRFLRTSRFNGDRYWHKQTINKSIRILWVQRVAIITALLATNFLRFVVICCSVRPSTGIRSRKFRYFDSDEMVKFDKISNKNRHILICVSSATITRTKEICQIYKKKNAQAKSGKHAGVDNRRAKQWKRWKGNCRFQDDFVAPEGNKLDAVDCMLCLVLVELCNKTEIGEKKETGTIKNGRRERKGRGER